MLAVLMVLTLALALTGCGTKDKAENAKQTNGGAGEESNGTKVKTSIDGERIKFESDEGEVIIDPEGTELPDNWPAEMPTYPKAKIVSSVKGSGDVSMAMAVFQTDKPVAAVVEFYDAELPGKGWSIDNRIETGQSMVMVMASKGDLLATVSTTKDEASGKTTISINIAPRQQ